MRRDDSEDALPPPRAIGGDLTTIAKPLLIRHLQLIAHRNVELSRAVDEGGKVIVAARSRLGAIERAAADVRMNWFQRLVCPRAHALVRFVLYPQPDVPHGNAASPRAPE